MRSYLSQVLFPVELVPQSIRRLSAHFMKELFHLPEEVCQTEISTNLLQMD